MSLLGLAVLLVIAAIAGGIGQALAGYPVGGCLMSIVVGFIGALLGRWMAGALRLPEPLLVSVQGQTFPVLWSIIGSAFFCGALGFLARRRPLS